MEIRYAGLWIVVGTTAIACSGAPASPPPPTPSDRATMVALGLRHATAWDLYEALRQQAAGGQPLQWARVQTPRQSSSRAICRCDRLARADHRVM